MRLRFNHLLSAFGTLVILWCIASIVAQSALVRRAMERRLAKTLGTEVQIARTALGFPATLIARDAFGWADTDHHSRIDPEDLSSNKWERILWCATEIRVSPGATTVRECGLMVRENPDGTTLPACFSSCKEHLLGTADLPCPARILSALATLWHPRRVSIADATFVYQDAEKKAHPVFIGLDWTSNTATLPGHDRLEHGSITYRAFGAATSPDGRPNDGTGGTLEWLGGISAPLQVLWVPSPCANP